MKNWNENNENTDIPDNDIDYGVHPWWTTSPGLLSRWASILLGMRRRSGLNSENTRLSVHTSISNHCHKIALWTSFPMLFTVSKSDSQCSRNPENKIASIPPEPAYKSWKLSYVLQWTILPFITLQVHKNLLFLL